MFPKYNFDDSLSAIERLGKKKEMNVHMVRYRMDQLTKDDDQILLDETENLEEMHVTQEEPIDEFEALIDEQIALTTAHSRMLASSVSDRSFGNISGITSQQNNTSIPSTTQQTFKPISQPVLQPHQSSQPSQISDETRARIAENRLRALAIYEQKKKEVEQKKQQDEKNGENRKNISNIFIDDDDF